MRYRVPWPRSSATAVRVRAARTGAPAANPHAAAHPASARSRIVLARSDAPLSTQRDQPATAAPTPQGWSRRFTIATWIVLGAAVSALWALLLLGDSLNR